MTHSEYQFFDRNPPKQAALDEVLKGLQKSPKQISPKYFYDERGSKLFEKITELPEYYLTRTETSILDACSKELAELVGQDTCLIEYGSGSSKKVRLLLNTLNPSYYVPVDISKSHLQTAARAIFEDYGDLAVYPTCADFTKPFTLPEVIDGANRCGFFPGSSIGNFERNAAVGFLNNVHKEIGEGGFLILGIDTRKNASVLEAAYNDASGVTAEFNLNLLHNLNRLTESDFDEANYDHHAFYDSDLGRVEMHLVSNKEHKVEINGHSFTMDLGDSIHTENSYKYSLDEIQELATKANMRIVRYWQDPQELFVVALFQAV